jgi:DMSO/TMAO reductase YedYZ molybdopterin-dependent catalytic subunit
MPVKTLKLHPVTQNPYNAETPFNALLDEQTPADLFYVRNHFSVPSININRFELEVNGAVANPLKLTLDRLRKYPARSLLLVMECAGNGRAGMKPAIKGTSWRLGAISQAEFSGTSLSNLLAEADLAENATDVRFTGADQGEIRSGEIEPYARSLPLEVAMHPDTILVWEMNGKPLDQQHGCPLRLVVPGWYGMAAVKWLQEITVLIERFTGFFQTQEYVYIGEEGIPDHTLVSNMRVRSLILEPEAKTDHEKDEIQVTGIAWTGVGEVTKVELSFDGGRQWVEAHINRSRSPYGAIRWEYIWYPDHQGEYTILARAYDSNDETQPLNSRWNEGGYGNNSCHQVKLSVI